MHLCLWDAALGNLPMWVVGRTRVWILIHQGVNARRRHHLNPPALAQLPSQHMQGAWGDQVLAGTRTVFSSLCPFLFKDYMWQQISSGGQSPPSCFFLA